MGSSVKPKLLKSTRQVSFSVLSWKVNLFVCFGTTRYWIEFGRMIGLGGLCRSSTLYTEAHLSQIVLFLPDPTISGNAWYLLIVAALDIKVIFDTNCVWYDNRHHWGWDFGTNPGGLALYYWTTILYNINK